jgi:NAD+ synthase
MDYDKLADDIASWMRSYARSAACGGYVVGLSGGIDSAVTAALSIRAVGAADTLGVLLPCHSQAEDAAFAQMVVQALGLAPVVADLTATYDALVAALPAAPGLTAANVKPRLRMTALYYLAQARGYLVAGTGNKPEMMVGYFTKYGDGGVDIEPLGALYKGEVRALARVLGIPEPVIARPPTAGLWPGQTDEGELGITYDALDSILHSLETGTAIAQPETTVKRVRSMIAASAHKRAMPPVYPVSR